MTIRKRDLTKREGQVLKLITAGKTNLEIADFLNVSVKTIETHKHNILIKVGAESSKDLKGLKIKKRG